MVFVRDHEDHSSLEPYRFRFEPLVRACRRLRPDFDIQSTAILTGLNNLRQIFKFASGTDRRPFRIDLQMLGTTLMMTRWEKDPSTMTQTSLCRGYGRGFERVCTKLEERIPKPTSHHRIVSYTLGSLSFVVQFEADLRSCDCRDQVRESGALESRDELEQANWSQSLICRNPDRASPSEPRLEVTDSGIPHTLECLVEIKSRDHKNRTTDDIMAQLWLSGCRKLYLARHVRGRFDTGGVEHVDVAQELISWQDKHEDHIAAFLSILRQVRDAIWSRQATHAAERYALVLQYEDDQKVLKLWLRDGGQEMLPDDFEQSIWSNRT